MDAPKLLLVAAACLAASLHRTAADDSKTEKSIVHALADADRYAGGFADAHVADAWERAEDGWVRGGYTLVSGDVRTAVRYAVDPSGEMRVMARRPGPTATLTTTPGGGGGAGAATRHRSPLLGGYRPPFYQRLVHFGGLDDAFEDLDSDFDDDEAVDDDDPFFFDGPDGWDAAAAAPADEWARLRRNEDGVRRAAKCRSAKCRLVAARAPQAGPAAPGLPAATPAQTGSASFRSGHYDMVVETVPVPGAEKPSR